MDYGLFGVRFLFLGMKRERCSIDELLIYFATPPFLQSIGKTTCLSDYRGHSSSRIRIRLFSTDFS